MKRSFDLASVLQVLPTFGMALAEPAKICVSEEVSWRNHGDQR
jgi:hypothetical protein